MTWQPIKDAPKDSKRPILLISNAGPNGYITDPYAGWQNADGTWERWPHPFPPTHFMIIPPLNI